jgi:hypothetical protein
MTPPDNISEAVKICTRALATYKRVKKLADEADGNFDDDWEIDNENAAVSDILNNVETLIQAAQSKNETLGRYQTRLAVQGELIEVLGKNEVGDIINIVNEQADDDGLWFQAETAAEAYLQQELRYLHAAIEALGRNDVQEVTVEYLTAEFGACGVWNCLRDIAKKYAGKTIRIVEKK